MEQFFVVGGKPLNGEVEIFGAKNSLLPIIASSILVDDEVCIENAVPYSDVLAMCKIIEGLGGKAKWQGQRLILDCRNLSADTVSHEVASVVRSSIFTLGPILARMKSAKVAYPGGCDIGLRPIDLHLGGLRTLGAKVVEKNGYIYAGVLNKNGGDVTLSFPSVGATENLMMYATSLQGQTRIFNCAQEPEIVDLQNFINACGGQVSGAGESVITITGGKKLHGASHYVIPDRIEAGTYMIAVAMCGGRVVLKNAIASHNDKLIAKLMQTACKIKVKDDTIEVLADGHPKNLGEVETGVYPAFPTDLQSQITALACVSEGYSLIIENLFEARNKHIGELLKMGADIRMRGGIAIVKGRDMLYGADLVTPDLRGGASLVLASLRAEGYSTIKNIGLIDRGYYKIEEKLASLGAEIKRIKEG
ncbi:MAG: UDP-N-acetylglucosamine 1-carboxyvinyltransferase [Clostridia bacterium]|nr:UDP-N-acetylglucosamine 1-carboxyvinyltransferase [Clostridia bacterium]